MDEFAEFRPVALGDPAEKDEVLIGVGEPGPKSGTGDNPASGSVPPPGGRAYSTVEQVLHLACDESAKFLFGAEHLTEYANTGIRLILEMKTLVVTLTLAVAGLGTAQAQMIRPSTTTGAVLGAVAGGLIGGHNGDRWAQGIAVGAVAGAVVGSVVGRQQDQVYRQGQVYQPAPVYQQGPVYQPAPQVVYQPAPIQQSVVVPNAPTVYEQQPQVVYSQQPQVVYAQQAPQVVYVLAAPRVVYAPPAPVISFGFGYGYDSGPRYYPSSCDYDSVYYAPRYYGLGHHDYSRGHGNGHGDGHGRYRRSGGHR